VVAGLTQAMKFSHHYVVNLLMFQKLLASNREIIGLFTTRCVVMGVEEGTFRYQ
jgi:hypothetical protein